MLNMNVSRRALFAAIPAFGAVGALAGCATLTAAQVTTQVVQDVNTVAVGLSAEIPALQSLNVIPAAVATVATTLINDVKTVAATISTSLTTTAAQPLVSKIEGNVNALVTLLASFPLPTNISLVLKAAVVLLPVIETSIGLVVPAAASKTMTPAQARQILLSA